MPLADSLAVLRARWTVIVGLTLFTVALAMFWGSRQVPTYRAAATVVLDLSPIDPTTQSVNPILLEPAGMLAYLATQVDLGGSAKTAKQAVQRLGLLESTEMRAMWLSQAADLGVPFEDWIAGLIRQGMEVRPLHGTPVLEFAYVSSDPRMASDMANAFAQAYIDVLGQLQRDRTSASAQAYARHAETARLRLSDAWGALLAFQREHGILTNDPAANAQMVAAYRAARVSVSQDINALAARQVADQARQSAQPLPDQEQLNPQAIDAAQDLATLEALMQRQRVRHGPNHPSTLASENAVAAVRSRLQEARAALSPALRREGDVSAEQARQVAEQAAQLRGGAQQQVELSERSLALQHKVARATLDYQQAYVASRLLAAPADAPAYGATWLSAAQAPAFPYTPTPWGIALLATLFGLMVGMATAAMLERRDRRVHTPLVLNQRLKLDLLGTV